MNGNINGKMENIEFACLILEANYVKSRGRKLTLYDSNIDLFPIGWATMPYNEAKIKILKEALEKKCKIIETLEYSKHIEGVRYSNEDEKDK